MSQNLLWDGDGVAEIAGMSDVVLRNLRITDAYHELGQQTTAMVGGLDSSWVTFGCWASKTAGSYIRGEELPALLRDRLAAHKRLHHAGEAARADLATAADVAVDLLRHPVEHLLHAVDDISTTSAAYLAEGNRVVFEEVGGSFADFIRTYQDGDYDEQRLIPVLARYDDGVTVPDHAVLDREAQVVRGRRAGGQTWLKDMMRTLRQAAISTDDVETAQLVMLANMYGGLHEQTRLQTYITASLDVPVEQFLLPGLRSDAREHADEHRHGPIEAALERIGRHLAHAAEEVFHEAVTRLMMSMRLPDGTLHLGEDVAWLPGGPDYPAELEELTNPQLARIWESFFDLVEPHDAGVVHRLADHAHALLARLRHRPDVLHSSASDWGKLDERMRFVMPYFRGRQRDELLRAEPPFTDGQRAAMLAGELPAGPL